MIDLGSFLFLPTDNKSKKKVTKRRLIGTQLGTISESINRVPNLCIIVSFVEYWQRNVFHGFEVKI